MKTCMLTIHSYLISYDIASTYGYPAHWALEDTRAMKTIYPATLLSNLTINDIEW